MTESSSVELTTAETLQVALLWKCGGLRAPDGPPVEVNCKADAVQNVLRVLQGLSPDMAQQFINVLARSA